VGSTLALAGLLSATFAVREPTVVNVLLAFLVPLLAGAAVGWLNGSAVSNLRVAPFIVTLGTMTIVRGITYIYTNAQPITGVLPWYTQFGEGYLGPIPIPVITFFVVVLVALLVQEFTRFGRYVYAVGGNPEAARASGVPVKLIVLSVYVICGALAGLSAIILTGRLHAAQSVAGTGYELNAIAAVVIGGTSFSGGKGSVHRTVVGALIIGVLLNGLNLLNVTSYIQQILIGSIVVGAVWVDERLTRRS
jgi:ribose/xylose/arabinose/galactoside ABC-type transport system permease subunit